MSTYSTKAMRVKEGLRKVRDSVTAEGLLYAAGKTASIGVSKIIPGADKVFDSVYLYHKANSGVDAVKKSLGKVDGLVDAGTSVMHESERLIRISQDGATHAGKVLRDLAQFSDECATPAISFKDRLYKNKLALLSNVYLLYNCKSLSELIAIFISTAGILDLEESIVTGIVSRIKTLGERPSLDQQQVFKSSQVTIALSLLASIFSVSDPTSFLGKIMKSFTDFSKNMESIKKLQTTIEDMASEFGFDLTERAAFIRKMKDDLSTLIEETEWAESMVATNASIFCKLHYMRRFEALKRKVDETRRYLATKKVESFINTTMASEILGLGKRIDKLATAIHDVRQRNGKRVTPVGICFYGDSQIGKSTISENFHLLVKRRLRELAMADPDTYGAFSEAMYWQTWNEQSRDQYDTGYDGQEIHYNDEAFNLKSDEDQAKFLKFISNNRIGTVMAELSQKGKPYETRMVHVCCNQFPKSSSSIRNVHALANRFPVFVHLVDKRGEGREFDSREGTHLDWHLTTGHNYFNKYVDDSMENCGECFGHRATNMREVVELVVDNIIRNERFYQADKAYVDAQYDECDIQQNERFYDAEDGGAPLKLSEHPAVFDIMEAGFDVYHKIYDVMDFPAFRETRSAFRRCRLRGRLDVYGCNILTEVIRMDPALNDPTFFLSELYAADAAGNFSNLARLREEVCASDCLIVNGYDIEYFIHNGRIYYNDLGLTYRISRRWNTWYEQRVYASRHYADELRKAYPFMFWLNDINAFGSYVIVEFLFNLFGLNDWVFLREIVMATLTTLNTYIFMVVVIVLLAKLLVFLGICDDPNGGELVLGDDVELENDSGEVVAKGKRRKVVAENDSGEVVAKGRRRKVVPENDSGEVVARGRRQRVTVENASGEVLAKGKRSRVVVEANAYDGLAPRARKVVVTGDDAVQEWCTPEERKASQAKLQASVETSDELVAYLSTCAEENVKFKVGLIQAAAARSAQDEIPKELDSQEIVADPCAVDAAKRLVHNNLVVVWYYENENVKRPLQDNVYVGSSHGVGLRDKYFITPAHGYAHSRDNPAWAVVGKFSQTVETKPGKLDVVGVKSTDLLDDRVVKYRARCVGVDRSRDIGLWEIVPTKGDLEIVSGDTVVSPPISPGVMQFPDMTNLIAPTGEEWVSMTREMQGIQIIPSLLSSGTVIFTDVFFSYLDKYNAKIGFSDDEMWEYQDVFRIYSRSIRDDVQRVAGLSCENTKTKSGDCGGPLIVQNPRIRWKFAGIHVLAAADRVTTMSAMVTMDALYRMGLPRNDEQQVEIREFPFNFDDPNYQLVEDGYGVHLPEGEVVYVGDTLKGLDKQPSSKRVNHRTPFHGCFPEYKVPTVLSVNDPRIEDRSGLAVDAMGNQSILLTEANKSVNHDEIWYDERLLDSCVSDLIEYSADVLKNHDLTKVGFDVALKGDPDTPHFESLNLKTSNGFPCSLLWGKGRDIWNEERQVVNESGDRYMRNRVKLKEANAKRGVRVFSYWKNTLKDELRKPAKIRTANSRMFTVGPRESTIYTRMLFGRYKAAWTIEADKLFHAVGIDPKTVQWRDLIRNVARHKYFLDEDFTNFDKYALRPFMQAVGEIIIESIHRVTGESDEIKQERYVMWSEFIFTLCVNRSTVYMKTSGNPSGNAMTTTLNCWLNVLYHYYIFRTLELTYPSVFSRLTVNDFRQHVSIRVFGDDVILGVGEPFHLCYTPKYIQGVFKLLGQKITPADKSSELAWRPLRDLEFLKRKFRGDQGIVWAPIEIESIYSMYSWSSLFDTDIEGWRNLVFETLIELVHHGRDEFGKFTKTLRDYICSRKFRLVYPKLTEAIFPLLSRSFTWYRSVARNRYYGESDLLVGQKMKSVDFKSLLQSVLDTQCEQESECKGLQLVPETREIIANLRESISECLDRNKPTIHTDSLSEKMDRIVCESLMGYKKGSMEFVYQAVNSYCQLTGVDPPTIDFEERSPDGRWLVVCSFERRDYHGGGKTKKEAKHKIFRAVLADLLLRPQYCPVLDGWRGKYAALTGYDEQQMDTGLPARKMHVRSQIENADIAGETALTINGIITDQGVVVRQMDTSDGRQMVLDTEPQIAAGHEVVSTDYFDFPDKLKRMQYVGEVELGKPVNISISPKMNTRLYLMRSIFRFYHGHAIVKLVVRAPLGYAHKVKVCVGGVLEDVDPASKQGFIWDVSNVNTVYVHAPFIKEVFMTPFDQPSCQLAIMPVGTPTASTVTPTPVYIGYQVDYYDVRCYISRHVTSAMVDKMFVEPKPDPPKPPPVVLDQQEISVVEPVIDYAMIGSTFRNPYPDSKSFIAFYDKFPQKDLIEVMTRYSAGYYRPYLSLPFLVTVHDLFNGNIGSPQRVYTQVSVGYTSNPSRDKVLDDIRTTSDNILDAAFYDKDGLVVEFTDRQLLALRAPALSKESKDFLLKNFPPTVEFKLSSFNLSGLTYVREEPAGGDTKPPGDSGGKKPDGGGAGLERSRDIIEFPLDVQQMDTTDLPHMINSVVGEVASGANFASQPDAARPETLPGPLAGCSTSASGNEMDRMVGHNIVDVAASQAIFIPLGTFTIEENWTGLVHTISPYNWALPSGDISHAQVEAFRHYFCGPNQKSADRRFATYKITSTANAFQNARFIIAQVPPDTPTPEKLTAAELTQYPHKEHQLKGTETIIPTEWLRDTPVMIPRAKQNNGYLVIQLLENAFSKDQVAPTLTLWVEASNVSYSVPTKFVSKLA